MATIPPFLLRRANALAVHAQPLLFILAEQGMSGALGILSARIASEARSPQPAVGLARIAGAA